jgi:SAM-dependent methyltransferase
MDSLRSKLNKYLELYLKNNNVISVLEAGCGSINQIELKQNIYTAGIDISKKQLDRNFHIDHKILGDIQYYEYKPCSFDLIICWDVLEHLKYPELAINGFVKALKENGIVVLKLPNVLSIKGLITKYTPLYLHRLVYRCVYKSNLKFEDERGPFKTFLKFSISPNALKKFALLHDLEIVYLDFDDISKNKKVIKNKIILFAYKISKKLMYYISLKKLDDSDFVIVLQKKDYMYGKQSRP